MERCGDKHAALLQTKAWSNNTDTVPLDTLCSVLLTTGPVSSLVFFFTCLSLLTCLQQFVLKKNKWKLWLVNTDVIFKPRSVTSAHTPTEHIL